jgi:DNA-binding PadR family transcriptional regulator
MRQRKNKNLMWLAVLALLYERPMHPYEIAALIKRRLISSSIKLNFGTLYATINALLSEGYISIKATEREGNLPERTVYQLTPTGIDFCLSFLRALLQNPEKEYPRFAAGLSFVARLPPDEVVSLLSDRVGQLKHRVDHERAELDAARSEGINDLYLIEISYSVAMIDAELAWLESAQASIKDGRLTVQTANQVRWKALVEQESKQSVVKRNRKR